MRNCPHFIGFPIPEISQSCRNPLGMESGQIPNSAITASSQLTPAYGPENARLHFKGTPGRLGAWILLRNDHGQWLQVDFGRETQVTGIATQGITMQHTGSRVTHCNTVMTVHTSTNTSRKRTPRFIFPFL